MEKEEEDEEMTLCDTQCAQQRALACVWTRRDASKQKPVPAATRAPAPPQESELCGSASRECLLYWPRKRKALLKECKRFLAGVRATLCCLSG